MIQTKINESILKVDKGDLTTLDIEAFVFYARNDLQLGSGFGNAIAVRGGPSIQEELKQHLQKSTGDVVITCAGQLKAKYIIHAVGPKFQEDEIEEKLKETIKNSLKVAEDKGITKIAFPPMGAGFYGIPLDTCANIMINIISNYLLGNTSIAEVLICVMDNKEYNAFRKYLDEKITV
jgi:O-acetyl-ADP-ribose deacetylase (regulator of RNase III)